MVEPCLGLGVFLSAIVTALLCYYTGIGLWGLLTFAVLSIVFGGLLFEIWPVHRYTRFILDEIKLGNVDSEGQFIKTDLFIYRRQKEGTNGAEAFWVDLRIKGTTERVWGPASEVDSHKIDNALRELRVSEPPVDDALIRRIRGLNDV